MIEAGLWHGTERHAPVTTDSRSAELLGADSGGTSALLAHLDAGCAAVASGQVGLLSIQWVLLNYRGPAFLTKPVSRGHSWWTARLMAHGSTEKLLLREVP